MNREWLEKELEGIKIKDKRLEERLRKVGDKLMKSPGESIQGAMGDWAGAKGAYRLFDNEKLQEEELLKVHQQKTQKRLKEGKEKLYLAIQDTTKLNYTHHPKKEGLCKLNQNAGYVTALKGCLLHTTMITNAHGLPIGIADQKIYKHKDNKEDNKQVPITKKESYRWIEALHETKRIIENKNVISVCDRECDIFEFFVEAIKIKANVLVRSTFNRILLQNDNPQHKNLWTYLKSVPIKSTKKINITEQKGKNKRTANLSIRYEKVIIMPPKRTKNAKIEDLPSIELYAIYIIEQNPNPNDKPIEWMLITNIKIDNNQKAMQAIDWYQKRWQIENFHRILKSGCKIEDSRLATYEKLKKNHHNKIDYCI